MIGTTVSHYKIVEKLGGGGMGVVYKAEDTHLKRIVALKFLPPSFAADPDARERFIHEAQAASALDHPNICTIHETNETPDGQTFIVMGYYEGESLREKIAEGPIGIDDAVNLAIQVASGLARAHEAGIVHRDIKPANIMVTARGEAKIVDFGLAKLSGRSMLTKTGTTMGTAAYMSPEQARGEHVDQRADIWSLGVVLYEMLAGRRPFEGDFEQALIYSILNEEPKPPRKVKPDIPEALEQIVQKAMAKNPEERYQSASDLLADLEILKSGNETERSTVASQHARKRRIRRIALIAGLAVVVAAGGLVVLPIVRENALASNPTKIAVISFENQTGDKTQDYLRSVLQEAMITSLEQSKYVRVTTRQRIDDILKQIGKRDIEYLDNELGLEICRREGAQLMAVGTIARAGELYRTTLKLVDVKTLATAKLYSTSGKSLESLLEKQVDDLSRQISLGIGVSERRTEQTIRPVAEISTTSAEAYRLYLRGVQEHERLAWDEARHFLEMAVQKDSLFAMAWYMLYVTYSWSGDPKAAEVARNKAASLAWRVNEREQYLIARVDSTLRTTLLGMPGLTDVQFLRICTERFPREKLFWVDLGTTIAYHELNPAASIPIFQKALELDPTYAPTMSQLGNAYADMGDWENALETFKRYAIASPGDPNPYDDMGNLYARRQMYEEAIANYKQALAVSPSWYISTAALSGIEMDRENYQTALQWHDTALARENSLVLQSGTLYEKAFVAFWLGRLREAEQLLAKRDALLAQAGQPVDHGVDFLRMWIAVERRQFRQSRRALELWGTQWIEEEAPEYRRVAEITVLLCAGVISLCEGRRDSVSSCLARMDSVRAQVPVSDTSRAAKIIADRHRAYSSLLRSEWLLASGRSREAIDARQQSVRHERASRPYKLFNPGFRHTVQGTIPVMVDVVPRAFLAIGQLDSALTYYEMAVSHEAAPGRPIFPRYHYRLARVYEQKGLKGKAIDEYEKFMKIWGKADPIYKEPADARARISVLKRNSTRDGNH